MVVGGAGGRWMVCGRIGRGVVRVWMVGGEGALRYLRRGNGFVGVCLDGDGRGERGLWMLFLAMGVCAPWL